MQSPFQTADSSVFYVSSNAALSLESALYQSSGLVRRLWMRYMRRVFNHTPDGRWVW